MYKPEMNGVVYQIWPRSFKDSNDDGIGDLQGIISKLDYLKDLGITTIWLCPVYVSPNVDYGYDVSDYYNIQPEYGSLSDMDQLIQEAKNRGIGILMDLVANHTSNQHPWFQAALKDPQSKYRDYYIFKQGKNNKEPNNWIGLFGGSAWTKSNQPNEYVLTLFTPNQVDLNWENPEVRQEIYKVMKFWMNKGVAGFRMDVINIIAKTEGQMLVNPQSCASYSGFDQKELDMMFHFDLVLIGCGPLGKYDFRKLYRWKPQDFKSIFYKWQEASYKDRFWMGNFLSNHDNGRSVSRFGDEKKYRLPSAKAFIMSTMTAYGTPFIYQGEEIGMTNMKIDEQDWKDFEAISDYKMLQSMMHLPAFIAKKIVQKMTRDNARTIMQWDDGPHAGFSSVKPWFVLNPNHKTINVKHDQQDQDSILNFTKELIAYHQAHSVLQQGSFASTMTSHPQILAYIREDEQEKLLILINLDHKHATFKADNYKEMRTQLCNYSTYGPMVEKMVFRPYEARIVQLVGQMP
ncbi:MAG: glycosidase [Erysipelotrichaceae bacterium]|nr:MAG: glycosidase [Erysipelotrichaceae bacterium]